MSHSFDHFVAALRCARCGKVSRADRSTELQTKLAVEAEGRAIGVGDLIVTPGTVQEVTDSGYRGLGAPALAGPIALLETWSCPACGQTGQWAKVELSAPTAQGGRRVEAVRALGDLRRSHLDGADFLSEEAVYLAERLAGRRFTDVSSADLVTVLRGCLPA